MASSSAIVGRSWRQRARGGVVVRARLYSGLVLMTFTVMHLLNHTLGLVSLEALEDGRRLFNLVWGSPPATLLLLAAFLVHAGLGLLRLWQRATWRMPFWEAIQLVLALLIPILGTLHILGTAVLEMCCDMNATYLFVLVGLWPDLAWRQTIFTLVVWLHGCIGLHYWLRLKPAYQRFKPLLILVAVLLPVLAIVGFVDGGRAVYDRAALNPTWLTTVSREQNWPTQEVIVWLYGLERWIVMGFAGLVATIILLELGRAALIYRLSRIKVTYDGGDAVLVPKGVTLLDASRMRGIPHAAVCGGRGRCSTCRVRVTRGLDDQPPPNPAEQRVLGRLGAERDVRLACQLRPTHDLAITLLLPADASLRDVMRRMDPNQGTERIVAVLFADLRGFTRLSETRLPYDVVFILNRYFSVMGTAIESQKGHVDKFLGDGIMALFGLETRSAEAARHALAAAAAMARALDRLNVELAQELKEPLEMGIGVHAGPAIVGELGWGRATSLTAIGDTVNAASRLEALTKELRTQLIVSQHAVELAGIELEGARAVEVDVRGRRAKLPVLVLDDARRAWPLPPADEEPRRGVGAWIGSLKRLTRRSARGGG